MENVNIRLPTRSVASCVCVRHVDAVCGFRVPSIQHSPRERQLQSTNISRSGPGFFASLR